MSEHGSRRVAVVTCGGAIGGAIAARLAPDHTVVVLDRAGDVVVDLGDADDVRRAAELRLERYGRRDVLVHARWSQSSRSSSSSSTPGVAFRRSTWSQRYC